MKNGSGLVVVNVADNDYTGGSTLNAGTLRMGASTTVSAGSIVGGPLGKGTITLNGGTLQDNGTAISLANAVTISGNVTFSSSGSGSLTFTNEVAGNGTLLTTSPTLNVTNTTVFQQVISGSGRSITKTGAGTLQFTAANTYNGGTIVNEGTLEVTSTGSLASGSNLTTGVGGTASFANSSQTLGTITNAGAIKLTAASETMTVTTLNGSGVINFATGSAENALGQPA